MKWPICLYPTYGGADPLANTVAKMSNQLGDMFAGRIDGHNIDPSAFDEEIFTPVPLPPGGGPPIITIPGLKKGTGGSFLPKADSLGVTRGVNIEVDASVADGTVCITDKNFPDLQLISFKPESRSSTPTPGAKVLTKEGHLTLESPSTFDIVLAPGKSARFADGLGAITHIAGPTDQPLLIKGLLPKLADPSSLSYIQAVDEGVQIGDAAGGETFAGSLGITFLPVAGDFSKFHGFAVPVLTGTHVITLPDFSATFAKAGGVDGNIAVAKAGGKLDSTFIAGVLASSDLTNDAALEKVANKNANGGYAGLDGSAHLLAARFPALTGDVTTVAGALGATLAAGSASVLNSGTLADARLSTNIVRIDTGAVFGANTYDLHSARMCIPIVSADPVIPSEGEMWFRSDTQFLKIRTGGVTYSRAFA